MIKVKLKKNPGASATKSWEKSRVFWYLLPWIFFKYKKRHDNFNLQQYKVYIIYIVYILQYKLFTMSL